MARREGLEIKKIGKEFNIYGDEEGDKYPINRIAGSLKRMGCTIRRTGDPISIMVTCPPKTGNPCPLGNPCNPGPTRYVGRGQTLPGRQMWLLEEMCLRAGIDTMMIDPTLTYWENKAEIERELHTKLHLTYSGEKAEEARTMAALLSDELKEQAAALADYMRSRGKNH